MTITVQMIPLLFHGIITAIAFPNTILLKASVPLADRPLRAKHSRLVNTVISLVIA